MKSRACNRIACCAAVLLALVRVQSIHAAESEKLEHGLELFRRQNWAAAAAVFKEVDEPSPGTTNAALLLGKSLVNLSRFNEAGSALRAYIAHHPASDEGLYLLAFVRFRENRPVESLEFSTRAARIKPPRADDLKIVGLDYVLLGDWNNAFKYLKQALDMDPGNIEARYSLGRVLYQQNQFDDAIAAFQRVLQTDPKNVKAADNLGLAFEGKNDIENAISSYSQAITSDRAASHHNEQPYLNLGMLLTRLNRTQEALPLLLQAVRIRPDSGKTRCELGRTYLAVGRVQDAERELREAVRLAPEEGASHYLLGRAYHRLGKSELANKEFEATAALNRAKRSNLGGMASSEKGLNPE